MARVRLDVFSGEVPKLASHLLDASQAQSSLNVKVDSGMLEAWNEASKIENTNVNDPLSLFKYIQDDGATEDWWVSADDLDFVENPQSADTYERVFFAGATNDDFYTDEISGMQALTVDEYDPSTGILTLNADRTPGDFAAGDYIRDTDTAEEYEISEVDFSGGAGADTVSLVSPYPGSLSATVDAMEVLYTAPNYGYKEIRFFANDIDGVNDWDGDEHFGVLGVEPPDGEPAPWVDTGSGSGRAEGTNDYSYLYTYVNSYGEEGPPSSPTTPTSMNTADKVYVQFKTPEGLGDNEVGMPADWHYDITHVNLYRTSSGSNTTDFLFVEQLTISSIENPMFTAETVNSYVPATGVLTMATDFTAGDIDPAKWHYVKDTDNDRYYRVTAVSLGGGAGADTITIGDAKPYTLSSTVDIVEWITEDDVDEDDLGDVLVSTDYYPPITDLDGLTSMATGHLYAWKDNVLYYSFPYLPHAWKTSDVISIDRNIVVARGFANVLCIATDGEPYVFSGQSPRTFNKVKMGKWVPCISKRATVKRDSAILFPTREGLIQLDMNGAQNVTQKIIKREQWVSYVMGNAFAIYRNDRYYAYPNNASIRSFMIDFIDGTFQPFSTSAECGYLTPDDGIMYYVSIDASEGESGTRRSIKCHTVC